MKVLLIPKVSEEVCFPPSCRPSVLMDNDHVTVRYLDGHSGLVNSWPLKSLQRIEIDLG